MKSETGFLTTSHASRFLTEEHGIPVAASTLRKFRCVGGGPKFSTFGRRILYRADDLKIWATQRIIGPKTSTSDDMKGLG